MLRKFRQYVFFCSTCSKELLKGRDNCSGCRRDLSFGSISELSKKRRLTSAELLQRYGAKFEQLVTDKPIQYVLHDWKDPRTLLLVGLVALCAVLQLGA